MIDQPFDPMPLSTGNVRTAMLTGQLLRRRPPSPIALCVQLWVRNLLPNDRGPLDELQFVTRSFDHDMTTVGIRTEAEMFADILGVAPLGRWLPLRTAPERIDEWSEVVPLPTSRDLLRQFLSIVREHADQKVKP